MHPDSMPWARSRSILATFAAPGDTRAADVAYRRLRENLYALRIISARLPNCIRLSPTLGSPGSALSMVLSGPWDAPSTARLTAAVLRELTEAEHLAGELAALLEPGRGRPCPTGDTQRRSKWRYWMR